MQLLIRIYESGDLLCIVTLYRVHPEGPCVVVLPCQPSYRPSIPLLPGVFCEKRIAHDIVRSHTLYIT